MEEISNSDSPDPLSSTPPRFATPAASDFSTVSSLNDIESDLSDSSQGYRHHSPQQSSSPASIATLSSMPSSDSEGFLDLLDQHYANPDDDDDSFEDVDDDFFLDEYYGLRPRPEPDGLGVSNLQDSEEESLFVNPHDNDDIINQGGAGNSPETPGVVGWLSSPRHGFFEQNPFLARMNRGGQAGHQRDELVGMEVDEQGNPGGLQGRRERLPRAQPDVIDLTGDDGGSSSPVQPISRRNFQNARRRRSQQRSTPPRLARSDASYMGAREVIDLISDSDDASAAAPPPRRNMNPPRHAVNQHRSAEPELRGRFLRGPPPGLADAGPRAQAQPDFPNLANHNTFQQFQDFIINRVPILRLLNGPAAMGDNRDGDDIVMLGRRELPPAGALPQLNLPPVRLDYLAHPFAPQGVGGGPSPKPPHEPPKEVRPGFTRDTGEDVVAICPSCDQELAYDPDGDECDPTTPARKARTKKDKAEHHFWAVKACGHVYCKKCYDNRKPVGKHPIPVGFKPDPKGTKNKIICAVEDCDSDVSSKAAWVGIFM
ncbi:hypothetical protein AAE478_002853 [Parahypoxylon ruwenzoriense]